MMTRAQVRVALLATPQKAGRWSHVGSIGLARVNSEEFLKNFPGIQLPALLLVSMGTDDQALGNELRRDWRWNWIVARRDTDGSGYIAAEEDVDWIVANLLNVQICNDEITVSHSHSVGIAFTNPRFAIYQISFTTQESAQRWTA
jgi:hypothetical protein